MAGEISRLAATMSALRWLLLGNLVCGGALAQNDGLYTDWAEVLNGAVVATQHPGATEVDYAWLSRHQALLEGATAAFRAVTETQFKRWSDADQLAFLINAYNALTLQLVLTGYPDIDSIKDLGSLLRSPWKQRFFTLLGEPRTLDELEHQLIRGQYVEPRIHFAVNCASCGCPALAAAPYTGAQLDRQLDQALEGFLSDPSRNRFKAPDTLELSPIFKWYREDFAAAGGAREFVRPFAAALGWSGEKTERLRYTRYDWTLNDRGRCDAGSAER